MPDIVTHYYFGEQTCLRSSRSVRNILTQKTNNNYYAYGCSGPDPWFFCSFLSGRAPDLVRRGSIMHEKNTADFLNALCIEAWAGGAVRDQLFAYAAGFACHYALDACTHPYITYVTGNYDGTPNSQQYRGNHMLLEHAIDCYVLRNEYHTIPWKFNIRRNILKLRSFAEELRLPLNNAYHNAFGWKDTFDDINRALQDYKRFFQLTYDPWGLINRIFIIADNQKSAHSLKALSYFNKDMNSREVDYLNISRREWKNPYATEITSSESFPDLFEKALSLSVSMLEKMYGYIYHSIPFDMAAISGDLSYNTGLPCEDKRNSNTPAFNVIF